MTNRDLELDVRLLALQPLVLYRLARAKYANLSGVGSAMVPGRWNLADQNAIYTSLDAATTVLEKMVHIPKSTIPDDLAMMEILLIAEWKPASPRGLFVDRGGRSWMQVHQSLAQATTAFEHRRQTGKLLRPLIENTPPFAIAVPSVVVPSWNVVLYPDAPGFREHIRLRNVNAFVFDERLFPPDTPRGVGLL